MKFGEKVRMERTRAGLTQRELADAVGVSLRTIANYEQEGKLPKKKETYALLAETLSVDVDYLLGSDEGFILNAAEKYGYRGAKQAEEVIAGFSGLCAGGTLSEEDKDAVMRALQDIYWESKARNVQKYTPKKYKES